VAEFVKRNNCAPAHFFACEAAGLRWLADVAGGVPCAQVIGHTDHSLTLQRLTCAVPTPEAAREFGRRLATTHNAGAAAFGAAPDGWRGDGYFGPLSRPLPMTYSACDSWGEFYAHERLVPMADMAAARLSRQDRAHVDQVARRCLNGDFDSDDAPARLHGDLWSGNVVWTSRGAVLIDPAAHGGHRETDLAMLALFGCPFLGEIVDAYQHVCPLRAGWKERVGLHQLYPLLAHVVLFGRDYVAQTVAAARSALACGPSRS